MTADDARALALIELERSGQPGIGHYMAAVYADRAQVYATLALSLDEIVTVHAEAPDGPVRRFLDLGTSHLPPEVCHHLDAYEGVIAYPKRTETDDFGWWMWVPDDPQESADAMEDPIPAEVLAVQLYARARGCDWVMFDRDSDAIPELPTWEW